MKNFLLFIIIFSLLTINLARGENLYTHRKDVFSIKYPEGWNYEETSDTIIKFYPSGKDGKRNSLVIIYGYVPFQNSLYLEDMEEHFKKSLKENYPQMTEIEKPSLINYGRLIHLKTAPGGKELFALFSIVRGIAFIIVSTSPEDKFMEYKDTYLQMIDSFKSSSPATTEKTPTDGNSLYTIKNLTGYRDKNEHFYIKYPEGWEITDNNNTTSFNPPGEKPENNGFRINLMEKEKINIDENGKTILEEYKKNLSGFQEIEKEKDIKLDKNPAKLYLIQGQKDGKTIEKILVLSFFDNMVLTISASASIENFGKFYETYIKMIESFKFTGKVNYSKELGKVLISGSSFFMIKFPHNWEKKLIEEDGSKTYSLSMKKEDPLTNGIIINHMSENNFQGQEGIEQFLKNYRKKFDNINDIEKPYEIVLGQNKWKAYHFKGERNKKTLEGFTMITKKDREIYIVHMTGPAEDFLFFKIIYIEIMKGFHIVFPEKIKGWKLYDAQDGSFSIQYPPSWYMKEKKSKRNNLLCLYPYKDNENKKLIISYIKFDPLFVMEKNIDKINEELTMQYEATGYEIIEKSEVEVCHLSGIKYKIREKNDIGTTTVITFTRDEYIFQIYLQNSEGEDMEFNKTCNDIIETFRPF